MENLSCLWGIYAECASSRCKKAPSMTLFRALCKSEGGWVTLMTEIMSCRCYAKPTRAHAQADDMWGSVNLSRCSYNLQEALTVFVVYLCFSAALMVFAWSEIVETPTMATTNSMYKVLTSLDNWLPVQPFVEAVRMLLSEWRASFLDEPSFLPKNS